MWARKKREPLLMKEGVEIRDMEGLRENFDLELILKYFKNGTLLKWLRDWHCDEEAAKVYELDEKEDNGRALCEIFGVDYLGTDPEEIAWRTERLNRLKKYTSDRNILSKVDNVAFDVEDLFDILDEGKINEIYLCGEEFILPSGFLHFTEKNYHGVGNVKVKIDVNDPIDFDALEITFENIQIEGCELKGNDIPSAAQIETVEKTTAYESHSAFDKFDDVQALKNAAKAGNAAAMLELGNIYLLEKDDLRHAAKWYRKAAENNVHFNDDDDEAMYLVALAFKNSIGGDENPELAFQWMQRAAETGRIDATAELGAMYLYGYGTDTDFVKAYELIKTAVDEDNAGAMKYFGDYFIKCKNNYSQAGDWYKKAADKGHEEAKEMLEVLAHRNDEEGYSESSNMHIYSATEAEATVTIENTGGLHARPASIWIQTANNFKCNIHITAKGQLIDAKNMVLLMSLCINRGTQITIYANGTDAVDAIKTLKKLVENKFGIE